jgi:nucleotide-binding universal stress UspA family protein
MPDTLPPGVILCPIELAAESKRAIQLAAAIAQACSRELVIVHTVENVAPAYFTPEDVRQIEAEFTDQRRATEIRVAEFLSGLGLSARPAVRLEEGDAASVIQRLSRTAPAAIVVMATHGRRGMDRLAHGSVAERVLRESHVPVLTVGPGDHGALHSILCAVTESDASRNALAWAIDLARCLRIPLTVLHVAEPGSKPAIPDLCAWIDSSRRPDCSIQEFTRHGNPAREILSMAEETGAGLLVTGAEHKWISDRTAIGATAEEVLRESPCPVLTVWGGKHAAQSSVV